MSKTYIHYGSKRFKPQLFTGIRNDRVMSKPWGGLWASPVDAEYGWSDWNEDECFAECDPKNSFRFTLKDGCNLVTISCVHDVEKLFRDFPAVSSHQIGEQIYLDWVKMVESGIDGVELELSNDRRLYWVLYGWDCDSVVIFNPDVIQEC